MDEKVAAAAVSSVAPNSPFSCRLRDHCSIYTAELQAILFALKQAYQSHERKFIIFSDSLSALQALGKLKTDHPLLIQIQELLHMINAGQKPIVFLCRFLDMLVFEETRLLIELRKKLLTTTKTDSRSHAFFGPKTLNCQICISNLAERME